MTNRLLVILLVSLLAAAGVFVFLTPSTVPPAAPADGRKAAARDGAGAEPGATLDSGQATGLAERCAVEAVGVDDTGQTDEAKYGAPRTEVRVRVLDDSGRALPGVDVVAEVMDPDEWRVLAKNERKAVTNQRGVARLTLFDGRFFIGANRRGLAEGFTTESLEQQVELEPVAVDIMLRQKSASLRAVVVDDRGLPVPWTSVRVRPDNLSRAVGEKGDAWFQELLPGDKWVSVEGLGGEGLVFPSARSLCLAPGEAADIRLEMPRYGRLRFRLAEPLPAGVKGWLTVVNPQDPFGGLNVRASLEGLGEGECEVPPATYRVSCRFRSDCAYACGEPVPVEVRPGATSNVILPVNRVDGVLSGVVLDGDGRPAADVFVRVICGQESQLAKATFTDDAGTFLIKGIPEERLAVFVLDFGWQFGGYQPALELSGPKTGVEVRLPRTYAVTGVVLRGNTGMPAGAGVRVGIAWIDASEELNETWVGTDGDGQFRFDGLPAGTYQVAPRSEGVSSAENPAGVRVTVGPHAPLLEVRLTLAAGREDESD